MRRVAGALLLFAVALSQGCVERGPIVVAQSQPVAVVQPQDHLMGCPAILAEVQANAVRISDLAGEQGLKAFQNGRSGVGGHFIGSRWFGADWREAAEKEIRALQIRHQYLMTLAEQKQCGTRAQ